MKFVLLCFALASSVQVQTNPIAKVLTLLADLQTKVLAEGEAEQKQYEEFTVYCKDSAVTRQYAIKDGKAKVEQLSATIEKAAAEISNFESDIASLAKTMTVNAKDLQSATTVRNKERADYEASDADLAETVDMITRAVGIIEREMKKGGSFAQVSKKSMKEVTDTLYVVLQASAFSSKDMSKLQSLIQSSDEDFLEQPSGAPDAASYENQSGGIVETMEDMKDKAHTMRNDAQKAELNTKHAFEMLAQSLNDALKVDTKAMSEAKAGKGNSEEVKATAEGDLSATQKSLAEDQKSLADLSQDCQQKAADWETSTKSREEELEALTQARKIIAEKTGGATSQAYGFIQLSSTSKAVNLKVVEQLKNLGKKDTALAQLAMRAQAAIDMNAGDVFGKVKGMISEMIEKLVADAAAEASHKAFCDKEMGESQEKIADHRATIDKFSTRKDKATASIEKLTEEVANLQAELAALAKQQLEMDKLRAEQKETYGIAKVDYEQGIEGLTMALQLLRDYYAAPADDSFVQQPDVATHSASSGAASGIIGMLEVAQSDFSKMLADATVAEESAQAEYEKVSQDNRVTVSMKGADVKYKNKEIASLEKNVSELSSDIMGEQTELDAVLEYYDKLKPGCIAKPESYSDRKARREAEIEGLKQALEILEGESNTSFLAVRSVRRHQ